MSDSIFGLPEFAEPNPFGVVPNSQPAIDLSRLLPPILANGLSTSERLEQIQQLQTGSLTDPILGSDPQATIPAGRTQNVRRNPALGNGPSTPTGDGGLGGTTPPIDPLTGDPLDDSSTTPDGSTGAIEPTPAPTSLPTAPTSPGIQFTSGAFTALSATASVEFQWDGGGYSNTQLGIFSLEGMEQFTGDAFHREAARRATTNSPSGHLLIDDRTEGAKFSGKLNHEDNFNQGPFNGVKTFSITPGAKYGLILIPDGKLADIATGAAQAEGSRRPLYSMATANPDQLFQAGQLVEVGSDPTRGNTYVFEDLRLDQGSDRDYNDIVVRLRGFSGSVPSIDQYIDPNKDWRKEEAGKLLLADALPYVTVEPSQPTPTQSPSPSPATGNEPSGSSSTTTPPTPAPSPTPPTTESPAPNTPVPNTPVPSTTPVISPLGTFPWTYPTIEDLAAAAITPTSKFPIIGVIDTGFARSNPDLDYSKIVWGKDYIDNDADPLLNPGEGNEHGTHILGLISALRNNGVGIDGLAPDAPIWAARAVGSGSWAKALVDYVDYIKSKGQTRGLVNLSFDLTQKNADGTISTRYEFTPEERVAIEQARQAGVVLVVAAGNSGTGDMSVLAQAAQEFDNIISVAAAEQIDRSVAIADGAAKTDYSSSGKKLTISAIGGSIEQGIPSLLEEGLGTMAGTSVATAKVTANAALAWAANPSLNYLQLKDVLTKTATDIEAPGYDELTGYGIVNGAAAVSLAKMTKGETYNPEPWFAPDSWSGEGLATPWERGVAADRVTLAANAVLQNGGQGRVGSPTGKLGDFAERNLEGYAGDPPLTVKFQSFIGGSEGSGVLTLNRAEDRAFWVRLDVWNAIYNPFGGGGFGLPVSDRYAFGSGEKQDFERGVVFYVNSQPLYLSGKPWQYYQQTLTPDQRNQLGARTGETTYSNGQAIVPFTGGRLIYDAKTLDTRAEFSWENYPLVATSNWTTAGSVRLQNPPQPGTTAGLPNTAGAYRYSTRSANGTIAHYYANGNLQQQPNKTTTYWYQVPGATQSSSTSPATTPVSTKLTPASPLFDQTVIVFDGEPAPLNSYSSLRQGTLSSTNPDDLFYFDVTKPGEYVQWNVKTLSGPGRLRMQIIRDANKNDLLDANETVKTLSLSLNSSQSMTFEDTGRYYIRLLPRSEDLANYQLSAIGSPYRPLHHGADFNRDGLTDFAYQEKGAGNNSASVFTYGASSGSLISKFTDLPNDVGGSHVNLIWGDFNGDHRPDYIRQEKAGWAPGDDSGKTNKTELWLAGADGKSFRKEQTLESSTGSSFNGNFVNLIPGDFNGDGKTDFIRQEKGSWDNDNNYTAEVWLNTGAANFRMAHSLTFGGDGFKGDYVNIIPGDFDGDGRTDFIRQEKSSWDDDGSNTAVVFLSNGNGQFRQGAVLNNSDNDLRGDFTNLIPGDFNGDGKTDFIRQEKNTWDDNPARNAEVWLSNGGTTQFTRVPSVLDYEFDDFKGNFVNIIPGDFNGDGYTDILRQEFGPRGQSDDHRTAEIFLSNGNGTFSKNPQLIEYSNNKFSGNAANLLTGTPGGTAPFSEFADSTDSWVVEYHHWPTVAQNSTPLPPIDLDKQRDDVLGATRLGSNTRSDGKRGFRMDWGSDAPDARVPNDQFAMRAYTQYSFEAGKTYVARVRADDGYRLFAKHIGTNEWVNFMPDGFREDAYGAHKEIRFTVPKSGTYDFHFEFYDSALNAYFDLAIDEVSSGTSGGGNSSGGNTTGNGLHSNPTTTNPLKGFVHPLGLGEATPLEYRHSNAFNQGYAQDFGASFGANVYAMRSGTVLGWHDTTRDQSTSLASINDGANGTTANYLLIDLDDSDGFDDGYRAMYLHLQNGSIPSGLKTVGARVQAGELIGRVGYNGISQGVHLHAEVNTPASTSSIWQRYTHPFQWGVTNSANTGGYNLNAIPSVWKSASSPYVPMLVNAFADQGINNPQVLAYAAATIGLESSWNPNAQNTTDAAANTGYPGAGLAQITWKGNYQAVSDATGIDFVNNPSYMFDPYKSLVAKAAFYKINGMIPLIESGQYESAAGKYNAGNVNYRSSYTANVAASVPSWLPVFS